MTAPTVQPDAPSPAQPEVGHGPSPDLHADLDRDAAAPARSPAGRRPVGALLGLTLVLSLLAGGAARTLLDPQRPAAPSPTAVQATADLVAVTVAGAPAALVRLRVTDIGDAPVQLVAVESAPPTTVDDLDPTVRLAPGEGHEHDVVVPISCPAGTSSRAASPRLTVTVKQVRAAGLLGPAVRVPVQPVGRLARPGGICAAAAEELPRAAFDRARLESLIRVDLRLRLDVDQLPSDAARVVSVTAGAWTLSTPPVPVTGGAATLRLDGSAQRCAALVGTDELATGVTLGLAAPGAPRPVYRYVPVGPDLASWLVAVHDHVCGHTPLTA